MDRFGGFREVSKGEEDLGEVTLVGELQFADAGIGGRALRFGEGGFVMAGAAKVLGVAAGKRGHYARAQDETAG